MPTIKITGMSCGHCSGAVTDALKAIEGLQNVVVDLEKGEASYDELKPVNKEDIIKAITAIGFGAL